MENENLYILVLFKKYLAGCKVFCQIETINYEKLNKSVFKTISFCLKDDNIEFQWRNDDFYITFNQNLTYQMSYQVCESFSYCVGIRHRPATKNIFGDITSKNGNVKIGYCSICNKKSVTNCHNTIVAESLGDFFKNLGKKVFNVSKKMAKKVTKNPGRALDIAANIASAVASTNLKKLLTTLPDVITFHIRQGVFT